MLSHRRYKLKIILVQGEIIELLNDQLLNTRRLLNVSSLDNLSLRQKVSALTIRLENITKWKAEEEITKLFSPQNECKSKEKTLKRRPPYPSNSPEMLPCSKRSLSVSDEEEQDNVAPSPVKRIKLTREKNIAEEEYEQNIEDLKNKLERQAGLISSHNLSRDRLEEQIHGLRLELAKEYSLHEKYFKQNSIQKTIAKISKISNKYHRKTEKRKVILAELESKNDETNLLKEELARKDQEIKQLQISSSLCHKDLFDANNKIQNLEVMVSSLKGQQVKNVSLEKDVKKKTNMLKNLARKFVKLKKDRNIMPTQYS